MLLANGQRQKYLVVLVLKKRTAARGNYADDAQRDAAGLVLGTLRSCCDLYDLADRVNAGAAKQLISHGGTQDHHVGIALVLLLVKKLPFAAW